MSITLVNFVTGGSAGGALTSDSWASSAGNLCVVAFRNAESLSGIVVKNASGQIFTALPNTYLQIPSGLAYLEMFYYSQIAGNATDAITVTGVTGSYTAFAIWEINGAKTNDVSTGGTGSTGDTLKSPEFSTSFVDEIICVMAQCSATSNSFSAGGSYTLDSGIIPTLGSYCGAEHLVVSSLQTNVVAEMTYSTSLASPGIMVASFYATPSVPPNSLMMMGCGI